jgi:hypothetical protein
VTVRYFKVEFRTAVIHNGIYYHVVLQRHTVWQCFIIVTVCTVRGLPHVSLHYMFRPGSFPTLDRVYTLGVRCIYGFYMLCVAECIAY